MTEVNSHDQKGVRRTERRTTLRAACVLLAKGAALALAAFAVPLAIAMLVPDANDYAEASVLKHRQLGLDGPRKIVLVGGSNLAYGIDSRRIELTTGCAVANMGMNGYLGVRYMLNEVKPSLKPGDMVIIALEYDNYVKSVEGTANAHLALVKANPAAASYLTPKQQLAMLGAAPYVAQQKVLRLMREAVGALRTLAGADRAQNGEDLMNEIENLRGFTPQGDLVSHLGVTWPDVVGDGMALTTTPIDGHVVDLLQSFVVEMNDRGVKAVISFTPVERNYFERHQNKIEALYVDMAQDRAMPVLSHPKTFVFEKPMMFDTVYHLNGQGRALRTDRLIADIEHSFGPGGGCAPKTLLTQNVRGGQHE